MTTEITIKRAQARVVDDALLLDGFSERDSEVVSFVQALDDPEEAVHRVLQVGARALSLAQTTVDTAFVETAFTDMSRQFEGRLTDTVDRIGQVTDQLLDAESGALPAALMTFRKQLDESLGKTFDPDSKRSVLAVFEKVLTESNTRHVEAMRRVVDPDDRDSPMGRHRAEIIRTVKETKDELAKAVAEISEKIAVQRSRAEILEKTASKGFTYEEAVHAAVSHVAGAHADMAERLGRISGAEGTLAGDEVITLCLEDTRGVSARYVLELKDRKLGMKATHAELERAMANREATVGLAVFSRAVHAPTATPFQWWGNSGIVVLDKDDMDDSALRLACLWARMTVRRQLNDENTDVDFDRIETLITDARRALDKLSTIRRYHSSARKSIEQAGDQAGGMATEIALALDHIASEISR